jgi:hypothetical protein
MMMNTDDDDVVMRERLPMSDIASPSVEEQEATLSPPLIYDETCGHVFIIQGDLTKIALDVYGVPSDVYARFGPSWFAGISKSQFESVALKDFDYENWSINGTRVYKLEAWKQLKPNDTSQPWLILSGAKSKLKAEWVCMLIVDVVTLIVCVVY